MEELIERTLRRLRGQMPGQVSIPGDDHYEGATAIWAKPTGPMPRAVVDCQTAEDVQRALRAARECDLPLSVRGGGHDWAGRALCKGLVIDLRGMNGVEIRPDQRMARILGGALASDVVAVTDPIQLAPVTGSVGAVGMTGLTLGGGYGPLIGRFGLALDNLAAAEMVLADGRIVTASDMSEAELFWALRGGGGNFGVVTAMHHRLHTLRGVLAGILVYPFSEARSVLEGCADLSASAPEELTVQVVCAGGPDGRPLVLVAPTWSGAPEGGEAWVAPFLRLGTLLGGSVDPMPYGRSLTLFDAFVVKGNRTLMDTCSLPALEPASAAAFIESMLGAPSPGCAIITHEFKGAASRVPLEATAFGLRRDHVVIELLSSFADRADPVDERRHHQWIQQTRRSFDATALPGGYPAFLVAGDADRVTRSYGRNGSRLIAAKRRYDPDNVFRSAIPLPWELVPQASIPLLA